MEKNTTNFINEIKAEIQQLKERIGALEGKLEKYEAQDFEAADFTDMELTVGELPEPFEEPAPVEEDLPEEIVPAAPAEEPVPAKKPRKKAEASTPREAPAKPFAWMTDVPAASVKNIRSAISLQDRALYINTLFNEDFVLYDKTISDLNAMAGPQEAASYIQEHFPEWNLRSDAVYCFMMAVRKKLG